MYLGDDYEPCFEGSNVTAPTQFSHISLSTEFKHRYYAMMQEIKELKRQLKTYTLSHYCSALRY